MIAQANRTRELLNRAARERLKRDHLLSDHGVMIGGREYARGDRVIARHNDRGLDLDNGTLGTITNIGRNRLLLVTNSGQARAIDLAYVADHVEHAYALTAHGAQGATATWVGVIGRPEEFAREWAYLALSRARGTTLLHVVSEPGPQERERHDYGPPAAARGRAQTLRSLARSMTRSQNERLALEHLQQGNGLGARRGDANAVRRQELDKLADADLRRQLVSSIQHLRSPPHGWRLSRAPQHGRQLER